MRTFSSLILLFLATGCSGVFQLTDDGADSNYLSSGTILLSRQMPEISKKASKLAAVPELKSIQHGPLLAYSPPIKAFTPAENETWMEIVRDSGSVIVWRGKEEVAKFSSQGAQSLTSGVYPIQNKKKRPLWYAPDSYFSKRQLGVPGNGDRLRYRRGALGEYALFPAGGFSIHTAPVWSEDVGGIRLSKADLASIYYMLPVGSPVKVR